MVSDLLADHIDPGSVAQIAVEVLDRVLDYPETVAENLAPYAVRFGFRSGDGAALLDHLLHLADYRARDEMIAQTGRA